MKKAYMKPTMQIVTLRHQQQLLADSINTNLEPEDKFHLDETTPGDDFWAR